ncbi:hypothetical protein L7F22_046680 [Adiantum nelumboides]|nr:hypothetical protein [Adiantum nelumboides]
MSVEVAPRHAILRPARGERGARAGARAGSDGLCVAFLEGRQLTGMARLRPLVYIRATTLRTAGHDPGVVGTAARRRVRRP